MNVEAAISVRARPSGWVLLRLIGAFKLVKALALVVAAISVFHLIHKDVGEVVITWAHRLHIAPGNRYVARFVQKVIAVNEKELIVLGIVLLVYAAMFSVEGVGLLLEKHWAEWMTVITTAGLIPFELYEMVHAPTFLKAGAMAINIVIAVYLAARVRREALAARHNR